MKSLMGFALFCFLLFSWGVSESHAHRTHLQVVVVSPGPFFHFHVGYPHYLYFRGGYPPVVLPPPVVLYPPVRHHDGFYLHHRPQKFYGVRRYDGMPLRRGQFFRSGRSRSY